MGKVYEFGTGRTIDPGEQPTQDNGAEDVDTTASLSAPGLKEVKTTILDPAPPELLERAIEYSVERIKAEELERQAEIEGRVLDEETKNWIQGAKMDANDAMAQVGPADQAKAHSQALQRIAKESGKAS